MRVRNDEVADTALETLPAMIADVLGMRAVMSRARRFLRLSPVERRLLLSVALLLGAIRLGLQLLPLQTVRRLLMLASRPPRMRRADPPSPRQIVRAVARMSGYVPGATCLTRALAVQTLFEQHGYPSRLRIGIRRVGGAGSLKGHAWVESEGRVVIGGHGVRRYAPLPALDANGS